MRASSRTGLALYFTPSSSARQRAHIVRPYGWDACFIPVTHYKPTCREWSRPFRDFVLDDLRQHRTIPALRLKHRSGGCGTASAAPRSPYRHLELCGIALIFCFLTAPARSGDRALPIVSPSTAYNKLFHVTFLSGAPPMPHPGLRLIFCSFCSFPRCFLRQHRTIPA